MVTNSCSKEGCQRHSGVLTVSDIGRVNPQKYGERAWFYVETSQGSAVANIRPIRVDNGIKVGDHVRFHIGRNRNVVHVSKVTS